MKRTITVDQLIQEIGEILAQWDGESIVELYNTRICGYPKESATYIGGSVIELTLME